MGLPNVSGDISSEMDVDAFRRLFPLRFYERHLVESLRPDARPLGRARDTTLALGRLTIFYFCLFFLIMWSWFLSEFLVSSCKHVTLTDSSFYAGAVTSADGSALAKIGLTVSAFLCVWLCSCVCKQF